MSGGIPLASAFVRIRAEGASFKGDAEKVISGVDGAGMGGKLGRVVGAGLLGGLAVGIAGVAAVVGVGLKEAMDAQKLNAQFTAGIKSTGNAAHLSVGTMNELAASVAGYSGQSFESIGRTEQLLQTFTNIKDVGPNKIFDLTTVAAANMAAKMGGDASQYAIKLGRALNDPVKGVTALTRVGVQFTQGQKDSIKAMVAHGNTVGAQKLILGELTKEFGGAAKAAGGTLPGQLARLHVAFGEVSKSVVEGLLPFVLPGLTWIAGALTGKVIPAVQHFVAEFKNGTGAGGKLKDILNTVYSQGIKPLFGFITGTALPALKTFAKSWAIPALVVLGGFIVGTLLPGLTSLAGWLGKNQAWLTPIAVGIGAIVVAMNIWNAATKAFAVVQGVLDAVMAANPIGLVILAVVGLAAGLIYAYKTSETFRNIVNGVFQAIKVVIGNVVQVIITIFRGLLKAWTTVVGGILSAAASMAEALHLPIAAGLRKASDSFNGFAKAADRKLSDIANAAGHWGDAAGRNFAAGLGGRAFTARQSAANMGAMVAQGFASGIAANSVLAQMAATSLAAKAQAAMAANLRTKSPSKVTEQLGRWVGEGLAIGMEGTTSQVQAAAQKLANKLGTSLRDDNALAVLRASTPELLRIAGERASIAARLKTAQTGMVAALKTRNDYATNVRTSLSDYGTVAGAGGGDIVGGLQARLTAIKSFTTNLAKLRAEGLNKTAYKQLIDAGVDTGGVAAASLTAGGKGVVSSVNSLQAQIAAQGATLGSQASKTLYQAGVNSAAGLVRGLASQSKALASAAASLAHALVAAVKRALGIRSPSSVMAAQGVSTALGLVKGLESQQGKVAAAMSSLVTPPRFGSLDFATPQVRSAAVDGRNPGSGAGFDYDRLAHAMTRVRVAAIITPGPLDTALGAGLR